MSFCCEMDWDFISIREAKERFHKLCREENVWKASLRMSPLKGFHVRVEFTQPVDKFKMRRKWQDDGNRLVHEILHDAGDFGEILFQVKSIPYTSSGKRVYFEETGVAYYF